jgi:carbon monoxide dehydrogenase subunit G
MRFDNTFDVDAPVDEVYATLLDVERVAPCVPGAEVLGQTGEDAYEVAIKVKVGPISMTYRGTVEIVERHPEDHRAVMRARARETRGQGTADARVEMSLTEDGSTSHGTIVSDVQLAGRAAAMGRGVIQDVSAKIVDTFSKNLETMLAGEPQAAPAGAPSAAPSAAPSTGPGTSGAPATAPPPQVAPAGAGASAPGGTEAPRAVPPPTPPAAAPAGESSLPVGQIVGSVIASRLKDPRVIAGAVASALALFAAVRWRRSG